MTRVERVLFDQLLESGKDPKAARSMLAVGRPLYAKLRKQRNAQRLEDAALSRMMSEEMQRRAGQWHTDECWRHMAWSCGACECMGRFEEGEESPF